MANANTPKGLFPVSYAWGAPYAGAARVYYVPVGNLTALYFGDPLLGVTNSSDANGVPTMEIAGAGGGTYVGGVFGGIANNAGLLTIPLLQSQPVYLPATTAAYIYVIDDPFVLFEIQEDSVGGGGTGGAMVVGAGGRNADLVAGTGSTVTGFSGWQLDSDTLQTTSTLQLRIIEAVQSVDNQAGIPYAKWLVKINLHQMLNPTGI
jgi:hypothetical protein